MGRICAVCYLSAFFFCMLPEVKGIRVIDGSVTVNEGEDANLRCKLIETEERLEHITWKRKTQGNPENRNFLVIKPPQKISHIDGLGDRVHFIGNVTEKNGSISVLNVSLADEGIYSCIFTVFPSGPYKTDITLTVQVPPVVTVTGEGPIVAGDGERIIATCTAANSRPPATVFWRTDSLVGLVNTVLNTTQYPNGTTTVRSHLMTAPVRTINQREVQCIVNQPALPENVTVLHRINVYYPPQSVNFTQTGQTPGGPILQCAADSNPAPVRYTWSRLNTEMPSHSVRVERNRLVFLATSAEFSGLYLCEVSNQYGHTHGILFVYMDAVPRVFYGGLCAVIFVLIIAFTVVTFYAHRLWKERGSESTSPDQELGLKQVEREGAQEVEQEGAQEVEQEGVQVVEQEGAQEVEQEGAQEVEQEGAQVMEQEGAQEVQQEGAQVMEQEGAQEVEQEGAQEVQQEGAQVVQQEGAQELEQQRGQEGVQDVFMNLEI